MFSFASTFRDAVPGLRRRPGFAAVAIATIALAIGANTAIWSVVSGALLRPLPLREPERLVSLEVRSYTGFLVLFSMPNEEYIEQRIFQPFGMTRSMYCHSGESVPRRAHGYGIQNGVVRRAGMNVHTWPFAAGSMCSTAGDLVTWLTALLGGKVLSPALYAEMTTPATLADVTPVRYDMGVDVGRNYGGQLVIGHGGTMKASVRKRVGIPRQRWQWSC